MDYEVVGCPNKGLELKNWSYEAVYLRRIKSVSLIVANMAHKFMKVTLLWPQRRLCSYDQTKRVVFVNWKLIKFLKNTNENTLVVIKWKSVGFSLYLNSHLLPNSWSVVSSIFFLVHKSVLVNNTLPQDFLIDFSMARLFALKINNRLRDKEIAFL